MPEPPPYPASLLRRSAILLLSLLLPLLAHARPLLLDYTHTAWKEIDNAPAGATRIVQARDGWLWIATPTGLYRYDGVQFERTDSVHGRPLESSNVRGLAAASDGALWVGYRVGGVGVFRKDGARSFGENEGLHAVGVMHIEEAPDHAIWVAMRDGVAVLAPGAKRFRYLGPEAGVPSLGVFQVMFTRDGTVWLGTNSGAYFRRPGAASFSQAWPRRMLVSLCEGPDGTVWGSDYEGGYYRVRTTQYEPARPDLAATGLAFDSTGMMWRAHRDGIERAVDGPDQRLTTANGISGTLPGVPFEDREGNLWLSTAGGIDRLRPNRLHTLPVQLWEPALAIAPSGDVWVGDNAGDVRRIDAEGRAQREVPGILTASFTAPDGTMWLGGRDGVQRRDPDGRVVSIPSPDGLPAMRVHALQQDRDGALWAAFNTGKGVHKLVDGQWVHAGGLRGIPELLTTSMTRDGAGRLWMAHLRSRVTMVDGATVRGYGPVEGLQLGTVLQVAWDGRALWAGGENGVALLRDGRFVPLLGERTERFRGVSGIVRLPDGELWLHGADGLYRIAAPALAAWMKDGGTVPWERFDARDGMRGRAPQFRPVPSLVRAPDGLLWYATTSSVGTIDPVRIRRNALPPPVEIVGIVADGVHHAVAAGKPLALPAGTRDMRVDFTALSLSMPDRMRFRYRLVGQDDDWQEPSGNRQAHYANLDPGSYRFEVTAANEDGVWNSAGASVAFDVPPTFVQSVWFKALLALAIAAVLYTAYALRIRHVTRSMQERWDERMAERTRIARALHDTLLQSVQSLLLTFDVHSRSVPAGTPERAKLDQSLDLAEKLLVEGRDQITLLRTCPTQEVLEHTLEEFGRRLAQHRPHDFTMRVHGVARPLRPEVHEEIHAIAREALFNASHYAQASSIELELAYGARDFVLSVRDDGRGIDADIAAAGHRPGHWGLVGMRERAAAIGGRLEIASAAGEGTWITVVVPGRSAWRR